MKRQVYVLLAVILFGMGIRANEGSVVIYSDVSYNSSNNTVTAYSYTYPDYNASIWYTSYLSGQVYDGNGTYLTNVWASEPSGGMATDTESVTGNGCDWYMIQTGHWLERVYYVQYWYAPNPFPGYHDGYYDPYQFQAEGGNLVPYDYWYELEGPGPEWVRSSQQTDIQYTEDWSDGACQAPVIKIKRDGNDITGSTQTVSIGEKINLSVQIGGGGTSPQWSVPGEKVKNFVGSSTSSTKTPFTSQDLQQLSPSFYWVDGANGRTVTFSITVREQPYSASATFNVKSPTISSLNLYKAPMAALSIYQVFGGPRFRYGDPSVIPGVEFEATANNNGLTGEYQWVQLYNENKSIRLTVASSSPPCAIGETMIRDGSGLDVSYPYVSGLKIADSPSITLIISNDLVTVNDSATAWLMFRPTNVTTAIWVPLKKVDWSWAGSVRRIANDPENNWEKVPNTISNPDPVASNTVEYPSWTRNVSSNTFTCQN